MQLKTQENARHFITQHLSLKKLHPSSATVLVCMAWQWYIWSYLENLENLPVWLFDHLTITVTYTMVQTRHCRQNQCLSLTSLMAAPSNATAATFLSCNL